MTTTSDRRSGPLRELACGVDGLYLTSPDRLAYEVFADLVELKTRASKEPDDPVLLEVGEVSLRVAPHAFNRYPICLKSPHAQIGLSASKNMPPMYVQLRARALHGKGVEESLAWLDAVASLFGVPGDWRPSRVDLFCDVQGWNLTPEDRLAFVCRASAQTMYETRGQLTGFTFGKRGSDVSARGYNKTIELEHSDAKWWPELWGSAYNPAEPVWRIEFEFRRECLADFRINDTETLLESLGDLWEYGTRWLSHREPGLDSNRSRWPLSEEWAFVAESGLRQATLELSRIRRAERAARLEALLPQFRGLLASVGSRLGARTLEQALYKSGQFLRQDEMKSGIAFAQRLADKAVQAQWA